MRRPSRTGLSWMLVLCAVTPSIAQNLEAIGAEKPFRSPAAFLLIRSHIYRTESVHAGIHTPISPPAT